MRRLLLHEVLLVRDAHVLTVTLRAGRRVITGPTHVEQGGREANGQVTRRHLRGGQGGHNYISIYIYTSIYLYIYNIIYLYIYISIYLYISYSPSSGGMTRGSQLYIYIHLLFISLYISISLSIHLYISIYLYLSIYLYISLYISIYISIYLYIYLYISIYLYIYIYIYIYIYLYLYIYIIIFVMFYCTSSDFSDLPDMTGDKRYFFLTITSMSVYFIEMMTIGQKK